MDDSERKSAPFAFLESLWWKDMNRQLCVDGWPMAVVQINGLFSEAKRAYEAERQRSAKLALALSQLIEASECREDSECDHCYANAVLGDYEETSRE